MKTLRGARLNDMRPYEGPDGSFAQAALRWVLAGPYADAVVITMRSRQGVDEYLGASGFGAPSAQGMQLLAGYEEKQGGLQCRYGCSAVQRELPKRRGDSRRAAHPYVRRRLRRHRARAPGLRGARGPRGPGLPSVQRRTLRRRLPLWNSDRDAHPPGRAGPRLRPTPILAVEQLRDALRLPAHHSLVSDLDHRVYVFP